MKTIPLQRQRRAFSLIEAMAVVSIGALVTAAISGVVIGIYQASKNSVGNQNSAELTSLYYKADAAGLASTLASAYVAPGIEDTANSVTYRMQSTFTTASYAWDTVGMKFKYTGDQP